MTGLVGKRTGADLRSALRALERWGETPVVVEDSLDPKLEIARHYMDNFATSPAHPRPGGEPMVLYANPVGYDMPVLMGVFGTRALRNAPGCRRGRCRRKDRERSRGTPPCA